MSEPRNTIRTYALWCVAITSAFVMGMGWWINTTLASPTWCARALGAGDITGKDSTVKGLEGCVALLKIQLGALGINSHILFGVIALCLLVLMVIVIAGGRVSFKGGKDGVSADIVSADAPLPPAVVAAVEVAGAAVEKAEEIADASGTPSSMGIPPPKPPEDK